MIEGKSVIAIVPARGGSKGIQLKNLQHVGGISLVARAIRVAKGTPEIDRIIVSTDHEDIATEARKEGCEVPFMRPEALSGDRIADHPVIVDALLQAEKHYRENYGIVLMLQPTSPFRTPDHIRGALSMLAEGDFDAIWSVSETDSKAHPLKQLTLADSRLGYYDEAGRNIIARQQLNPVYHRNGVVYAFTRECLIEQKTVFGKKTGAYVINEFQLSIDTEIDLKVAEHFMQEKMP